MPYLTHSLYIPTSIGAGTASGYTQAMKKDRKAIAAALKDGKSITQALLDGGYAPASARQGKRVLMTKPNMVEILKEHIKLSDLGAKLEPKQVENAIAGKLAYNMITGESKGNEAAKLLGTMTKFSAFKSENQVGVIVLAPPQPNPALPPPTIVPIEVKALPEDVVE